MFDRLMHHGYGVHHAVSGREIGKAEHHWGCGLSLDGMDCWQCWGRMGWMRWVLEDNSFRVRVRVRVRGYKSCSTAWHFASLTLTLTLFAQDSRVTLTRIALREAIIFRKGTSRA